MNSIIEAHETLLQNLTDNDYLPISMHLSKHLRVTNPPIMGFAFSSYEASKKYFEKRRLKMEKEDQRRDEANKRDASREAFRVIESILYRDRQWGQRQREMEYWMDDKRYFPLAYTL